MRSLNYNGIFLEAERIEKNGDSVFGYNGKELKFQFNGVGNFELFYFEDGKGFDGDGNSEIEKMRIEQAQANLELINLIIMTRGV